MHDYWLLAASPAGERTAVHLGDIDPGDSVLIAAARASIGVPAGDSLATGWDVQLTPGEPHPEWLGNVIAWPPAA